MEGGPSAVPTPGGIPTAAPVVDTAIVADERAARRRAVAMAALGVRVPAALAVGRVDPHWDDPLLAGTEASPEQGTFTARLPTGNSTLSGAREPQGSAATVPSLDLAGAAVSTVAAFILVSAGEGVGAAAGDLALAGESGIRFGTGLRIGIARGGGMILHTSTRMLTRVCYENNGRLNS